MSAKSQQWNSTEFDNNNQRSESIIRRWFARRNGIAFEWDNRIVIIRSMHFLSNFSIPITKLILELKFNYFFCPSKQSTFLTKWFFSNSVQLAHSPRRSAFLYASPHRASSIRLLTQKAGIILSSSYTRLKSILKRCHSSYVNGSDKNRDRFSDHFINLMSFLTR